MLANGVGVRTRGSQALRNPSRSLRQAASTCSSSAAAVPLTLAQSHPTPALSAVKPPTQGAVSGLHMMHAFHAAGFPPGLIQCITGKSWEIGDYMTTHAKADCISFTGGDTGIKISQKAGMVPLQMELGGKDVCIVCADADLDLAAKSIISGGLSYQVCGSLFEQGH